MQLRLNVYMDSLAKRVLYARQKVGMSQQQLADASGLKQSDISKIERGQILKTTGLIALARALGSDPNWLDTGDGEPGINTNVTQGPKIGGFVPLLSNVQAGMFTEYVDNFHPGDGGMELIPTAVPVKQHTFALRVSGDSMSPKFTEGMLLIVEPDMEAHPGDYVIAKNGDDETTFKQLIRDGADLYLKPLNERYPIKPLGSAHIVGVVRAVELKFR